MGLALKTLQGFWVMRKIIRNKFQSNATFEADIFCFVDHTHRAGTELRDHSVVRNGLSDHWRESYFCETGKSMKAVELRISKGLMA